MTLEVIMGFALLGWLLVFIRGTIVDYLLKAGHPLVFPKAVEHNRYAQQQWINHVRFFCRIALIPVHPGYWGATQPETMENNKEVGKVLDTLHLWRTKKDQT